MTKEIIDKKGKNLRNIEIKRDLPLDYLRGYCVLCFMIIHILWQLNADEIILNYYMGPFPFFNLVPGTFFFISGASVAYMEHVGKINKRSVYKNIFLIICGGILLIIGFITKNWLTDPLFIIGTANLIIIGVNKLTKGKKKFEVLFFLVVMVAMALPAVFLGFEFPEVFNWPLFPWYICPFLGYIICLVFPNITDYKEDRNNKNKVFNFNIRSFVLFAIGIAAYILILYYVPPEVDDVHNIYYVFLVNAQSLMMYGIFGLCYSLLKHVDILKIFSSYALEIWFIHSFILFLMMVSFIRFNTIMGFLLILTSFVLINYLIMTSIDKKIKGMKMMNKKSILIDVFDFL